MGLLDLSQQNNEHLKLAKELSQSLVTANYRKRSCTIPKLCQTIDKLCSRHTKKVVYQVLNWYITQVGSQYCIRIGTVRELEHKFLKITNKYKQHTENYQSENLPEILVGLINPIPLTNAAEKVLLHSGNPIFPDDFNGLQFTKKCLYHIVDFQDRLSILISNPSSVDLESGNRTHRLIIHIGSTNTDPIQCCVNWIHKIKNVIWSVNNYNTSSLYPIVGSSPIFESIMRMEAQNFCGDVSEWVTAKFYIGRCK